MGFWERAAPWLRQRDAPPAQVLPLKVLAQAPNQTTVRKASQPRSPQRPAPISAGAPWCTRTGSVGTLKPGSRTCTRSGLVPRKRREKSADSRWRRKMPGNTGRRCSWGLCWEGAGRALSRGRKGAPSMPGPGWEAVGRRCGSAHLSQSWPVARGHISFVRCMEFSQGSKAWDTSLRA